MDNIYDGLLLYLVGGEIFLTSVVLYFGVLFICICYLDLSIDFLMLLDILYGVICNLIFIYWGIEFYIKVDLFVYIIFLCIF